MEILKTFTQRLEKLALSHDPSEAKTLEGWLKEGGLTSLEQSLLTYIQREGKSEPFALRVRRFDEWKTSTFDVFPYTTIAELKALIAKAFNLEDANFRFSHFPKDERNAVLVGYDEDDESLGEVLKGLDLSRVEVVVLPENIGKERKPVNMPVTVVTKADNTETFHEILLPITWEMTVQQALEEVGKLFPLNDESTMIFVDEAGDDHPHATHYSNFVLSVWCSRDFGQVFVYVDT